MTVTFKALGRLCVLALVVTCACVPVASGATSAAVPCWKTLLNEWYGGAITQIFKHQCYQEAINHLPPDIEVYSSARQDIEAAENAAAHGKGAPPSSRPKPIPGVTTPTTPVSTVPASTSPSSTTPISTTPITQTSTSPKKKHGIVGFLDDITPGNPQSFPLPLLILGALAILLVIAGGVGMLWQRRHPTDAEPS